MESTSSKLLVPVHDVSSVVTAGNSDVVHDSRSCVSDMELCSSCSLPAQAEADAATTSDLEMRTDDIEEEPFRLLRLGPAQNPNPKPKRFYRTFWRGLARRAVSHLIGPLASQ